MNAHTLWLVTPLLLGTTITQAAPKEDDFLVGIYYFCGWWTELPNKYTILGHDWRPDFPGRMSLLGEYNSQQTMDREIVAAADHGVDFFQILWYPMDYDGPHEPHCEHLNDAVGQFMASPNSGRMKFAIEYCNHRPFEITTDEKWRSACEYWCKAMKHPSYLRVDGRPVFKIHSVDAFYSQNGSDLTRVKARLDTLKRIARESGAGAPLIGTGVSIGADTSSPILEPYDFMATYMEVPDLPRKPELYPYPDLVKRAKEGWESFGKSSKKLWIPYVPSGWDPRPWIDPRPSFETPTREQWTATLRDAKATIEKYPNLGIPAGGKERRKALLIYAWNEFGEGGIVAPTKGDGYMKLEAIKEVFGR